MKLNLYVVESPLQVLSACEAKASISESGNNVILVRLWGGKRKKNDDQIKKVVEMTSWDEIIYFSTGAIFTFIMHTKIITNLTIHSRAFKGRVCNIFIGDFNSVWMHYLKCAVHAENVFLLDDGTDTITAYSNSISKNIYWPVKNRGSLKQRVHDLLYFFFYNKNYANKKITIFSSFDLSDEDPCVLKNEYSEIKKKMRKKIIEESEVYYFGAKYSESGVMCIKDELFFVNKVADYYKDLGKDFIYIPHRDEEDSKLGAINQLKNVSIKSLNMPAELYLIMNENVPASIGGAYTSVLKNVKVMFDCFSILSFRIPYSMLHEKRRDSVIKIYDSYAKSGIKIIDVPEV